MSTLYYCNGNQNIKDIIKDKDIRIGFYNKEGKTEEKPLEDCIAAGHFFIGVPTKDVRNRYGITLRGKDKRYYLWLETDDIGNIESFTRFGGNDPDVVMEYLGLDGVSEYDFVED